MAKGHRQTATAMRAFRIGDPKGQYPIYSSAGAIRFAGRWHRKGQPVIYASLNYSTAMLERLVHYSGRLPEGQHYIEITIPAGTSYEVVTGDSLPGWDRQDGRISRAFGGAWVEQGRSAILLVPSVVARLEQNVVINAAHPDTGRFSHGLETPLTWDTRLFPE